MAKEQSATRERQRTDLKEPRRYKVTIYNDDFTTMEFVVMILTQVFFKSETEASTQMGQVIEFACQQVVNSSAKALDLPHLVMGILHLRESWACYLLKEALGDKESNFMSELISSYEFDDHLEEETGERKHEAAWRRLVTCMNDLYQKHNPLIGREQELARTMQVLCRRDKNNPLHVGEPGVGKTALVWGLARMIEEGHVPERLKGSHIYQLDIGTLLAGTQYRGDFENRIKQIMDGIQEESDKNIVYIDEIHTLVGAGATGEGSMDASNMLKPYLESGSIRFIGSTTYEEYNRHFSRSKGLVRRFQQIDIPEPTPEETKHILRQLRGQYETFHGITYDEEALDFAVDASYKFVNDRFLPDKAIRQVVEAVQLSKVGLLDDNKPLASLLFVGPTGVGKTEVARVLKKKLGELQEKLTVKQIEMTLSDEAFGLLLEEGFTREYGAREMDRVIAQRLKPLLMREILFGSLKNGGKAAISVKDGQLVNHQS